MSSSRQQTIPISSSQRSGSGAGPLIQSSLDLVFSYSRSAGFFGENLQSQSSREEVGDDGEGSFNASNRDEDDDDDDEEDQQDEHDELDGGFEHDGPGNQRMTGDGGEPLPRNAKPPQSILASKSPQSQRDVTPASSPVQHPQFLETNERTPLISSPTSEAQQQPRSYLNPVDAASSPHDREQRNRRKSSVGSFGSKRTRRGSTFSREAWKAAIEQHRGESTWSQTTFNTVNVLIGVGVLAGPLALSLGGWIIGTLLLIFCALATNYTAKMLASLMRLDPTQHTYADVLIKAFGPRSRRWIYTLFVVELGTFSVAAIELFADSLASLFPRVGVNVFKIASYFILVPTTFLPLRLLSLTSLIGILSSIVLLAVIIADGSLKRSAPGSLWEPMETSFEPNWKRLPLSFGLVMSGFSGHAVVPSLYRDMKHPEHFNSMINVAYVIAFCVSWVFAALGYLMFGNGVSSEITRDLSKTVGYPVVLTKVAVWMVAINPLVKYAVANKPLITTFEHLIGLHPLIPVSPSPPVDNTVESSTTTTSSLRNRLEQNLQPNSTTTSSSSRTPIRPSKSSQSLQSHNHNRTLKKDRTTQLIRYWVLRPVLSILFVGIAIAIPNFDRVLAFLGSFSAFLICCIGPIGAYLILSVRPDPTLDNKMKTKNNLDSSKTTTTRTMIDTESQDLDITPLTQSDLESIVHPPNHSVVTNAQKHLIEGIGHELIVGRGERYVCFGLLAMSIVMAGVGTVWSFLPAF